MSSLASITAEELAALIAERDALAGALRVATTERDLALERLRSLQRQLFAAKSEARGTDQKDLFLNEAEALAPTDQILQAETAEDADEEDSTPVAGHQRKKRGRKPLDPALPRVIVRHELPESERVCAHDGHALVEIGTEISEQQDVIPEQVRVLQPEGNKRFELILAAAGCDSVIVMGESHMHDVRRRTLGTLPIKVIARTDSSFLLVKQPTEPEPEMFEETFACE